MNFRGIPLFDGISEEECGRMMECFHVREHRFQEGSTIANYDGGQRAVGIIVKGKAEMVRIDSNGNRSVLEFLEKNDLFGETLAFSSTYDSITVQCTADADILFIDYDDITKRCENACLHHSKLVENMFRLISIKAAGLSHRIEVLSGRSIREKLMSWFRLMVQKSGKPSFVLPFSITILADYLSVDRSAMSRELKKMRQDKLIAMNRKWVTLIDKP